ncbi:TPA: N-6 DNA methylase [Escherichia coli]|nr:N-6 DNA methylase [Escherichia coli]
MNKLSMGVFRCSSVSEILKYIRAITSHRAPIKYGVEKVEGKSYDRLRREANQKAIDLLNSLVDGATLTDEQRQILAGYTGEGGIGGSVSEYYTPKPIAEGVWEIMKLYGADVGNTLEPSAGTGVFNETKPVGTVMTATEISSVSGRINQLLHPEDSVQISPFEQLAVSTPNDSFDHVVGNVPFGGRDNTRNIDKPYAEETDMGSYFMLRMLDKIKPGGFMCVIVPPSIVSGSNMKRLRLRLSRKAEFLGAHRLPTGTFDANGTSTVVDVVLMRKHPAEMAEKIPLVDESTLESANVLWPTFISGKWFEKDGRRFVHGTQEKGFQGRIEVRADGQIDNQALKAKLIHRFESRIDWSLLDMAEPSPTADVVDEGEMRLINGVWQKYAGGRWIEADAGKELKIEVASYGADSWEALQRNLTTTEGRLGMTFTQMANVRDKYTTSISDDMVQLVDWINSQPEKYRERLYRGAMIGRMLIEYQDMKAAGHSAEQIEQQRLSLVSRLQAEIDRFGNPGRGPIAKLSGSGARAWFAFRGAIKLDGTISDELTGKLVTHDSSASYDSTSYQDTLRYLYSDLTRDPIQLDDFRLAFTGELPASDDELLNLLASTPGIAVSPYGGIVPFARATSGDINEIVAPKQEFLATLPDGPVKNNVLNQLAAIEEKRIKTPAENIRFKLNSRWFDRSVILEFLQENGYPDLRYVQSVQLEGDEMVSDTYHGGDGLFVGHRYGVVQRKDKETGEIRYEWDRKSGENATGFIQLQVPEAFEQEVNKRLARFGIDEQTVTHPVTPKYAKLIATLKEFFPEGKQIIFTDEKTQHQKLKRIICNALNLEPSKVGILNAQTVAEAGKTGKKLKAVKPPKELPDEPTDAQIAKYNEQMALYDAYIAQQNEMSLGGLEKIAADFQEGRTPIIICNKKAEVGINLHRGTTDIHHLTLPWTPASIAQRNGRGARVGSNRASVRVHYYCGKGSFDEYRLKTLKRKAGWISDILRSDKSEMENADANDMIEMQMYTAKDDGERLAMMQVQMDKAKAAQRARQKEQATIDLQNYIKAQHAAGEDVEVLTAELERSKAELEKTTAEVAKFKQAVMAKAADNADWKARWGSVHHTDRMLLAQYRASLKSAIQRKANISQAISRYEKLLNRTQKAATDIKRLRPLVEDAINKGILDVDPDLVNHANEFLVIGDRSWRVGQYYDCAGDIVRIKSLDFDSQRADVEIIFTFKGTKSGNWDVKTLDKQVDVTPDEDAVMQKISGGVSIAGINDIISCDDFYRFQQRGMIKITDSYGVQTTESGYSIDFVGTYTDPLKHAVYPDRRDGALKSSIAKWVLGMMSEGNNRQIRSAETFLVELFGSNYGDVIASYGDTLSPEAIQEKIADAIARMPEKTSQGATRNGDSELEVTNAIFGTNEFRASDYEITTAQFGTIGIYSNKAEIKQAMDAASARIAAEREANLNHAVAALTQSWVTAIREAATTGKITPAIADVVNDGSKFMDAYQMDAVQLPSAYGQLSYRMTYNLVSMFTDLAILGLVDLNEVTPELLSMRKNHVEILQRINTVLAGRTDEEKQADADRINLALGNITEEEIAARNEKQEELSSIQGDATSIAQSLGLNYRVSTADLKMMYAPKFAAGEVFGLQEASGMKGVLFRAKDAIKAKFGARWLPAKAKNSDFPGNWWIIETKHNVADVLAVIQQYA